ncbi:MAG: class I SAM-dependent methyltransferase [Deltaproteobacteria bacterium]|jgi:SAM-dependent methyltransferase|nr:class I SAM-dependent methyltransferase [Deltaproteobacteria bacterium]
MLFPFSLFKKQKQPEIKIFRPEKSDVRKEYFEVQIERTLVKSCNLSDKDQFVKASRLAKIVEYMDISKVQKALVIGCRNSVELDLLESAGAARVAAIDLVSVDPRILVCDMHDIAIADNGEYDFVFCSHALEHALDYVKVLREIRRVLSAGGAAFFEVPTRYTPSGADLHDFSNAANLRKIIESVFGGIEVLYAEDLDSEASIHGTHTARILFSTPE